MSLRKLLDGNSLLGTEGGRVDREILEFLRDEFDFALEEIQELIDGFLDIFYK